MKLIRAHYFSKVIVLTFLVPMAFTCPETAYLQKYFCTIRLHKGMIPGNLEILPDIESHSQRNMTLQRTVINIPLPVEGIKMDNLGFLTTVGSTLPCLSLIHISEPTRPY